METKVITMEELQAKYESLLEDYEALKKDRETCFEMYMRTKSQFDNFKAMVKSLVVLVE